MKPVRIQRSRKKGYNMQEHSQSVNGLDCVYVGRPGKWGNPFRVGKHVENNQQAANKYAEHSFLSAPCWHEKVRTELKGKNLACFCPLDQPCHADTLLKIANE